jgi:hypothetical protein
LLLQLSQAVKARKDPWEGVDLIRFDYGALFAVPIVVFGFNCHANAVGTMTTSCSLFVIVMTDL